MIRSGVSAFKVSCGGCWTGQRSFDWGESDKSSWKTVAFFSALFPRLRAKSTPISLSVSNGWWLLSGPRLLLSNLGCLGAVIRLFSCDRCCSGYSKLELKNCINLRVTWFRWALVHTVITQPGVACSCPSGFRFIALLPISEMLPCLRRVLRPAFSLRAGTGLTGTGLKTHQTPSPASPVQFASEPPVSMVVQRCHLGTHPLKEPMEPLNSPRGAKEFIYSLHPSERTCLLRELHRFESIAIAQGMWCFTCAFRCIYNTPLLWFNVYLYVNRLMSRL